MISRTITRPFGRVDDLECVAVRVIVRFECVASCDIESFGDGFGMQEGLVLIPLIRTNGVLVDVRVVVILWRGHVLG